MGAAAPKSTQQVTQPPKPAASAGGEAGKDANSGSTSLHMVDANKGSGSKPAPLAPLNEPATAAEPTPLPAAPAPVVEAPHAGPFATERPQDGGSGQTEAERGAAGGESASEQVDFRLLDTDELLSASLLGGAEFAALTWQPLIDLTGLEFGQSPLRCEAGATRLNSTRALHVENGASFVA